MTNIVTQDLHELLIYFSKNTYRAKDADNTAQAIMQKCILLADLDYTHSIIGNYGGELCAHYPSHLIILENEKHKNPNETPPSLPRTTETIYESLYDSTKLKELMKSARIARCRSRFPLPVILYKGRHICRSATLSGGPEIYGRSGLNYLFPGSEGVEQCEDDAGASGDGLYIDWQLFDRVRNNDIKLLKSMNVGNIIDLMVEKKKVKYGMYVTSSEKVDKEGRYNDFTIIALPYPGCEFFREFRDNNYIAKDLVFNWSQGHVDTQIGVPEDPVSNQLKIQWEQYEKWDLVTLTRNYLKLILKYLSDSSSGMLVHCISGWDRTPLFISLLRISLWADGAIHASMNTHQMLYYTIAYDWHLFGHDLQDRLSKGEEIFFFCFFFLKHIHDDEFSINSKPSKQRHSVLRNDSDCQLDNFLFENEPPIVGSVGSNISMSSANSRDSQENNPPNIFMVSSTDTLDDYQNNGNIPRQHYSSPQKDGVSSSRSPLLPNRTSPVAVPVPSRYRQRNESTSSAGSWQVISGTGSLHSSSGGNVVLPEPCYTCNKSHFGSCPVLTSLDSNATLVEDEIPVPVVQTRKDKLIGMRQLFYSVWSQTAIGFRMQDSSEGGLGFGQLLGNFAEKVGIISQQRTSL